MKTHSSDTASTMIALILAPFQDKPQPIIHESTADFHTEIQWPNLGISCSLARPPFAHGGDAVGSWLTFLPPD